MFQVRCFCSTQSRNQQNFRVRYLPKIKLDAHIGSDSEGSDTDLDLALLQRLEKIEGREAEQDRKRIMEEEEKVTIILYLCDV